MTSAAGFTDIYVRVIRVGNNADCRHTVIENVAKLAAGKSHHCVTVFLSHELSHVAGGAYKLRTLSGVKLNVVNNGTHGNVYHGKRVAGLDVGICARSYLVPYLKAFGSDNISFFAVLVFNESDKSGSVGIVLKGHNLGIHAQLISLEVDYSVLSSVSAALMSYGDSAVAVATRVLLEGFKQTLFGSNL